MKIIEKISLTIFSIIILVLSLVFALILFNWLEISTLLGLLEIVISTPTITNVALAFVVILMLLSIKCLFFQTYSKDKQIKTEGVLLQNEVGKLLISVETIENIVKGVTAGFISIKNVDCKIKLDKQINNVMIDLNLIVLPDTIIKELSLNLQEKIKETIKNTTEIVVKEINIKIKNIEIQKNVNNKEA